MKRSSRRNSAGNESDEKAQPRTAVEAVFSSPAPRQVKTPSKVSTRQSPGSTKVPAGDRTIDHGLVVVGLGASAGGLEALVEFSAHVPPDTGLAFVVVTHQHPEHLSLQAEILNRDCKIAERAGLPGMILLTLQEIA